MADYLKVTEFFMFKSPDSLSQCINPQLFLGCISVQSRKQLSIRKAGIQTDKKQSEDKKIRDTVTDRHNNMSLAWFDRRERPL